MDRIWLEHYPEGVPADIDPDRFRSLPALLESLVGRFGETPAFHSMGAVLSYAALDARARDFAAYLGALPGMVKGERVALMMPNLLQYPVALFGTLQAGMTVVNVNPLYTARELHHQLVDSGARAIVVLENFAGVLQQALPGTAVEHVIVTRLGDLLPAPKRWLVDFVVKRVKKLVPAWRIAGAADFRAALARGATLPRATAAPGPEDIAFLQYTGGTTGVAKGAMLTQRNVLANLEQTGAWIAGCLNERVEVVVTPLPLYHIFSLTSTLSFMQRGAQIVLIANPRDLPGLVKELAHRKFTVLTGVNTLFNGLLNTPGFERLDFSGLKLVIGGGAAVQKPVAERWLQATGHGITEAYGLTEASPGVCANPPGRAWNGTIGLPFPSTDVSIRDDAFAELPPWPGTGDVAPHVGELCVRGPQVMRGYWHSPDETAAALRDGWLRTGDVGYVDREGNVTITDRKKDMVLVSGFNVYPNEIESVIAAHPGVLECAVVGVPDARSGEAVKVVIVRKDPALTREAVLDFCRTQLTGYKMPRHVEFRDALAKTPIGKVLRRDLRDPPPG